MCPALFTSCLPPVCDILRRYHVVLFNANTSRNIALLLTIGVVIGCFASQLLVKRHL